MDPTPIKGSRRWGQIFALLFSLSFSALEIGVLIFAPPKFDHWTDWLIVGGAILFPIMAIFLFISMLAGWSAEREEQAFTRTIGCIFLTPVVLIIVAVAGFALYSAFGWLGTIPTWAAVIIVLLVLILLK